MPLFILVETSAGYALLKARDKKLLKRDHIAKDTETVQGVCSLLKLKKFNKFESAASALNEAAALTDSKVTPMLSSLLDEIKNEKRASLAVADPKLGNAINKLPGLSITPVSDSSTQDVFRAIRTHLTSLIPAITPDDVSTMSLGLSHSLSRHKLRFSTDKVDTMVIQAISLLDDLDKDLNIYAMRVKEWYGWHFPEMAKIINDNAAYSRVILSVGMRPNCAHKDLSDILPEQIEASLKIAAEISMGTEVTDEDMDNIKALAEQVVTLTDYRKTLAGYLTTRMLAIAPNLTALVGDLVGARLIAHAGSLMSLAKSPGSTIQILGAEKALFRALKSKHDTPKYGLIYHTSLINQASGRNKGKVARMIASKTALGLRIDTLADWGVNSENVDEEPAEEEKNDFGRRSRLFIERRLRILENRSLPLRLAAAKGLNGQARAPKFDIKEARKYNADADGLMGDGQAADGPSNGVQEIDSTSEPESESEMEQTSKRPKLDAKTKNSKDADKAARKAEKEAKRARKSERAAKREAKAAKKASKEAKRAAKNAAEPKKRKREDDAEKTERSKKKKTKSED